MFYFALKHLHVTMVVASAAGFLLRGMWMATDNSLLHHRATRVLPHVIDTVLLVSALILAWMAAQYPFVVGWVTAKVIGLLVYIALGTVALKRGRTPRTRMLAFLAAVVTYAWIVSVALSKNPAGFLPL